MGGAGRSPSKLRVVGCTGWWPACCSAHTRCGDSPGMSGVGEWDRVRQGQGRLSTVGVEKWQCASRWQRLLTDASEGRGGSGKGRGASGAGEWSKCSSTASGLSRPALTVRTEWRGAAAEWVNERCWRSSPSQRENDALSTEWNASMRRTERHSTLSSVISAAASPIGAVSAAAVSLLTLRSLPGPPSRLLGAASHSFQVAPPAVAVAMLAASPSGPLLLNGKSEQTLRIRLY